MLMKINYLNTKERIFYLNAVSIDLICLSRAKLNPQIEKFDTIKYWKLKSHAKFTGGLKLPRMYFPGEKIKLLMKLNIN